MNIIDLIMKNLVKVSNNALSGIIISLFGGSGN